MSEDNKVSPEQEQLQHRLAMLMDEIKGCFLPKMKMTLVARDPDDKACATVLTEDDLLETSDFLKEHAHTLKPVPRHQPDSSN